MELLNLAQQKGIKFSKVASTHGGEYHGPCPECGGKDRFVMQPYKEGKRCKGYYFCRQCQIKGDTFSFAIDVCKNDPKEVLGSNIQRVPSIFVLANKSECKTFTPQKSELPPEKWLRKASAFVDWAHKNLLQNEQELKKLELRGIPTEAVLKFRLGWNYQDVWRKKVDWGIESDGKNLWMARGIVIPNERHGNVLRINIRRADWKEADPIGKYIKVSGGKKGFSLYGNTEHSVMLITESELDAIASISVADDFLFAASVGSNISDPDLLTDYLAKHKQVVLICHDNDDAGIKMLEKLQRLYPHAQACPTPIGKDIGEAIEKGLNIREWLLSQIPTELHTVDKKTKSNAENNAQDMARETINEPADKTEIEASPSADYGALTPFEHVRKTADDWVLSDRPLIEWWLNVDRSTLPQQSFYPGEKNRSWEKILNPSEFYDQIDKEIKEGPQGLTARGALQGKIRKIKQYMEKIK